MRLLFLLLLPLIFAACAPQNGGDPAKAVEQYLTAKVAGDEDAMRPLLCSSMEADLSREAQSFSAVDAKLDGVTCTRDGDTAGDTEGDTNTVTCTGQIVATYGTENTTFPLTTYNVVQEDGEWKWCGEAQ